MTVLYIILYILGVVATMATIYCSLDKGYVITLSDLTVAVIISLTSWLGFAASFLMFFGNIKIFIKK
jgi:energy-converting hydrogenase Eha subunit B